MNKSTQCLVNKYERVTYGLQGVMQGHYQLDSNATANVSLHHILKAIGLIPREDKHALSLGV